MDGWHLDKKVPIGIIVAIVLQTVVLGFYVGTLDTRIGQLERGALTRVDERDRLITVEVQMRAIHEALVRIERRLDRPNSPQR